MDENLTRGYCQLGSESSRKVEIIASSSAETPRGRSCYRSRTLPPLDNYHLVYLSLVLCGAGFLLPYNTFIVAVDFYQERLTTSAHTIIDINLTYVCMAFVGVVLVNNLLAETVDLRMRIMVGYIASAATLATMTVVDVWLRLFNKVDSYNLTLLAVSICAIACTVQQHSFYGYTRILPRRYTNAVMAGESVAGLLASILRILTKSFVTDDLSLNTSLFFVIIFIILLICCLMFLLTVRTDFVQFYLQLYKAQKADDDRSFTDRTNMAELLNDDGRKAMTSDSKDIFGVVVIQSPTLTPMATTTSATTTAKPADNYYNDNKNIDSIPLNDSDSFEGQQKVIARSNEGQKVMSSQCHKGYFGKITEKLLTIVQRGSSSRHTVCKSIWPYMLSVWLTYCVTLALFPGILTEVISCSLTHWTSLILLTSFNLFDCVGKALTTRYYKWSAVPLVSCSLLRFLLIPLMIICILPYGKPLLASEPWPAVILSAILGLSNGYFGSISMIMAPSRVPDALRSFAGNVMALSYTLALIAGSLFAYLLYFFTISSNKFYSSCQVVTSSCNVSSSAILCSVLSDVNATNI